MKTLVEPKIIKLRNKLTQEIYYSWSDAVDREIDGVKFACVTTLPPTRENGTVTVNYIRRDSLEKVK